MTTTGTARQPNDPVHRQLGEMDRGESDAS